MPHRRVDADHDAGLFLLARCRLTDHDDPYTSLPKPADGLDGARDPVVDRDGVRLLRAAFGLFGRGRDADEQPAG
jgi:hypothetical protein